jgi:DNA-directed RNA polymerase subunit RPC12/RpoP
VEPRRACAADLEAATKGRADVLHRCQVLDSKGFSSVRSQGLPGLDTMAAGHSYIGLTPKSRSPGDPHETQKNHKTHPRMSNYHWVCFTCREAVRRPGSDINVRCPACGKPCDNIGYKIPVPPKSKQQLWRELAESYAQARKDYFAGKSASNVRRLHDLEQEIERIRGMEASDGRLSLIKKLKSELASVQEQNGKLLSTATFYLQGQLPPRAKSKGGASEA